MAFGEKFLVSPIAEYARLYPDVILDIEFDDVLGSWSWDKNNSKLVGFSLLSELIIFPPELESLFPTAANCSGTVTPWNTIITCEEYTSIELYQRIKRLVMNGFSQQIWIMMAIMIWLCLT